METSKKDIFENAMSDPSVPKLYTNGYTIASSDTDFILLMTQNGVPMQIVNMSFTTFKSFSLKAADAVKKFEENTGITINTVENIRSNKEKSKQ